MHSVHTMNLKLLLEETGRTWTLKPNRAYVIGSGNDCDIALPYANAMATRHCQLGFDVSAQCWYVEDLGTAQGTYINQQAVHKALISGQSRIVLGGSVALSAIPEGVPVPVNAAPMQYAAPPQPANGHAAHSFHNTMAQNVQMSNIASHLGSSRISSQPLRVLSWSQYVKEHVDNYDTYFRRLAIRFYLITGIRETPWVGSSRQSGFGAFDGYILPKFNGEAEEVSSKIEQQIGNLMQYEDTDCFIARLTDAHILDSSTAYFKGVSFSPFMRTKKRSKGDYRRFCITSYHWVRNYLLVERYGSDLFVSWFIRFEPEPDGSLIIFMLLLAGLSALIGLFMQNIFILLYPFFIWAIIFLIVPEFFSAFELLPAKLNSSLLIALLLLLLAPPVGFVLLVNYFLKKNLISGNISIPPLDLMDAKKLDDMVSGQVEEALRPILQSNGYTEAQMEEILTRTSVSGNRTFRR
jgi:hypothetical protein